MFGASMVQDKFTTCKALKIGLCRLGDCSISVCGIGLNGSEPFVYGGSEFFLLWKSEIITIGEG
jgi:hypothetical protein